MKRIIIYQENIAPIIIEDVDASKIEEYSRTLANLLETGNVSILHTSMSSVIIRPNKISSILVSEYTDSNSELQQETVMKEKIKENEDIITD